MTSKVEGLLIKEESTGDDCTFFTFYFLLHRIIGKHQKKMIVFENPAIFLLGDMHS
jgi:hypothetical protein